MKQILAKAGLVLIAAAVPAMSTAQTVLTGQWKNPRGSVIVRLTPCGNAICGVVINASEHAKETARKGGTPHLIGTRILSDLRPAGDGSFKGQAFDPKRNIHAPATVRLVSRDSLAVRGCAVLGLVCKEQLWTRIS
ncbi:MAG TPA: DUF2147 domain-containing protein [Sphingomicrobium sp.]|nr:DUF2147 domain-containing protein [Sphingomicrobium sp.]